MEKTQSKKIISNLIVFGLLFLPTLVVADGLVPCKGADCDFGSFLELIDNILKYLVVLTVPISTIMFAYAGFLYLSSQGNVDKRKKAHHVFTSVGVGLFFVLAAWLIVKAILIGLGADVSWLS